MKDKGIIKKMFLSLTLAVILLALITPAIGIDRPVEPFQKAKAMALMEGEVTESKEHGKQYILEIKGWGAIVYIPGIESIMLAKGTSSGASSVHYHGGLGKYFVYRSIEGSKPEATTVDWPVAMDIANRYLREIEAVRSGSK